MVELKSNAKINLFLHIGNRDPQTQLHFIDTLMIPISLHDTMKIEPAATFEVITVGGTESISHKDNIVTKAHDILQRYTPRSIPPVRVTIQKRIPTGGGLGGGSSNAATFLRFINTLLPSPLSDIELFEIAHQVGSDVPFFLNASAALVSGTGETVIPVHLQKLPVFLLLLIPPFSVSTARAYRLLDKKRLTKNKMDTITTDRIEEIRSFNAWKEVIANDFQPVLEQIAPRFRTLLNEAVSAGADVSFITGSGSSVVALFTDENKREKAESQLRGCDASLMKVELLL